MLARCVFEFDSPALRIDRNTSGKDHKTVGLHTLWQWFRLVVIHSVQTENSDLVFAVRLFIVPVDSPTFPRTVTSTVDRQESVDEGHADQQVMSEGHTSQTDLCSCVRDHWGCCISRTHFCFLHRSSAGWKHQDTPALVNGSVHEGGGRKGGGRFTAGSCDTPHTKKKKKKAESGPNNSQTSAFRRRM